MAQFGYGDGRKNKARLEKMVATKRLRLAMEMDEEERKARLKNMVANTKLRLALEIEEVIRAILKLFLI